MTTAHPLRQRMYNPGTGRFLSLDTFEGHLDRPQSLNKYMYCEGDPVNAVDPSGHDLISTLGTISIGLTLGSIALPALGAAYLSARGKVSPMLIFEEMKKPETLAAAVKGLTYGVLLGAGVQAGLLKVAKDAAQRIMPGVGVFFAAVGFLDSVKLTWQMVTMELPPQQAEKYVATLIDGTILTTLLGLKLRQWGKQAANDKEFWKLTPEDRSFYEMGQQILPNKVFQQMANLSPVERGMQLAQQFSAAQRGLLRLQGLWDAAKGGQGGFNLLSWLNSGATPSIRFIFGEGANNIYATIASYLHVSFDLNND